MDGIFLTAVIDKAITIARIQANLNGGIVNLALLRLELLKAVVRDSYLEPNHIFAR